jgi:hypothetical protein
MGRMANDEIYAKNTPRPILLLGNNIRVQEPYKLGRTIELQVKGRSGDSPYSPQL